MSVTSIVLGPAFEFVHSNRTGLSNVDQDGCFAQAPQESPAPGNATIADCCQTLSSLNTLLGRLALEATSSWQALIQKLQDSFVCQVPPPTCPEDHHRSQSRGHSVQVACRLAQLLASADKGPSTATVQILCKSRLGCLAVKLTARITKEIQVPSLQTIQWVFIQGIHLVDRELN